MYMQQSIVKCESGLYNRQATYFIQKANEFKSSIWVEVEDRKINAKSLLGVLSMGITKGTDRYARKRGLLRHFLQTSRIRRGMPLLILPPDLHICLRCVRSAFLFRSYDV